MKRILLLCCAAAPLWAAAQIKYHITGKLPKWKEQHQDSVFISYFDGKQLRTDSVAVVNGRFEFNGTVDQPYLTYIWCMPVPAKVLRDNAKFYLENGAITITTKDSLRHATIKGGMVNKDYQEIEQNEKPLTNRLIELRTQGMRVKKEELELESTKALNKEYRTLMDSLVRVRTRYLQAHPGHYMSLVMLKNIMPPQFSYAQFAPLYNSLDTAVQNTPLGQTIAAQLAKAKHIDIGAVMPEFSSLDTARQSINLTSVIRSGKLTLVDFWASWCRPCRMENPNVVKAFNAFHDKGFNIISVSLDKDAENWKKAIIHDGMPWYHVSGLQYWEEPVAQLFGITAVPDNFLLDANGKVLARGLRGEDLYKMIASKL